MVEHPLFSRTEPRFLRFRRRDTGNLLRMENLGVQVLLIIVLVAIEGYFAAAEIALISARRAALQQRAEEGSKGAKSALALTDDPTRLLATIQIGITFVGFLAAAAGAVSLAKPVEAWLRRARHAAARARRAGALGLRRHARSSAT